MVTILEVASLVPRRPAGRISPSAIVAASLAGCSVMCSRVRACFQICIKNILKKDIQLQAWAASKPAAKRSWAESWATVFLRGLRLLLHFEAGSPGKAQRRPTEYDRGTALRIRLGPEIPSSDRSATRMPRFNYGMVSRLCQVAGVAAEGGEDDVDGIAGAVMLVFSAVAWMAAVTSRSWR
jgi:hypothetical protein